MERECVVSNFEGMHGIKYCKRSILRVGKIIIWHRQGTVNKSKVKNTKNQTKTKNNLSFMDKMCKEVQISGFERENSCRH